MLVARFLQSDRADWKWALLGRVEAVTTDALPCLPRLLTVVHPLRQTLGGLENVFPGRRISLFSKRIFDGGWSVHFMIAND